MKRLNKKMLKGWKKRAKSYTLKEALCCAPLGFWRGPNLPRKNLIKLCERTVMRGWGYIYASDIPLVARIANATKRARRRATYRKIKASPMSARERRNIHREQKREAERLRKRDEMEK